MNRKTKIIRVIKTSGKKRYPKLIANNKRALKAPRKDAEAATRNLYDIYF